MQTTYPLSATQRQQLADADQTIQRATSVKKLLVDAYLAAHDVTDGHVSITEAGLVVETPDPASGDGPDA